VWRDYAIYKNGTINGTTKLTQSIIAGSVTTLYVGDTSRFADSGTVNIKSLTTSEIFQYDSKTATTLVSLTPQVLQNYTVDDKVEQTIFWFTDPDFSYFCKSNYKGKLVIVADLEDLEIYKLNYFSILQTIDAVSGLLKYKITFNISFKNETTWDCTSLKVNYSIDGASQDDIKTISINTGIPADDGSLTIIYDELLISSEHENKQFSFTIAPDFVNDNPDLPQDFKTKHTLQGSEILSTYFNYDNTEYESYEYL